MSRNSVLDPSISTILDKETRQPATHLTITRSKIIRIVQVFKELQTELSAASEHQQLVPIRPRHSAPLCRKQDCLLKPLSLELVIMSWNLSTSYSWAQHSWKSVLLALPNIKARSPKPLPIPVREPPSCARNLASAWNQLISWIESSNKEYHLQKGAETRCFHQHLAEVHQLRAEWGWKTSRRCPHWGLSIPTSPLSSMDLVPPLQLPNSQSSSKNQLLVALTPPKSSPATRGTKWKSKPSKISTYQTTSWNYQKVKSIIYR